jgi:riboflavin kinase/FMN adenylyltransferase
MKLYYDSSDVSFPAGTAVTIGAYDGVHIGHRYLISKTIEISKEIGAESVVVTFDRHPAKVVRPESAPLLLSDLGQKLELLEETGVDAVCVIEFDANRAMEGPVEFVEKFLVGKLNVKYVVVGSDFHFGHNRQGNVDLLSALGRSLNFEVFGAPLKTASENQSENVSSTLIRRLVSSGDMDRARQHLGRRFELRGVVVPGDQRGSTELGFPTANVSFSDEMVTPPDGVYAGWVVFPDGSRFNSAISLGTRPTYYPRGGARLLEAFILGFEGDLYQRTLRIVFGKKIRDQERFSTTDELQEKISEDIKLVSSFCESNSL